MKVPRILSFILSMTMIAAVLSGCGNHAVEQNPPLAGDSLQKYSDCIFGAFDTAITVTAYCTDEEEFARFLSIARTEYNRYNRLYDIYSAYENLANLRTVNINAGIRPVEVDRDIIDLLLFAREIYDLTGGEVNVAMGRLLSVWHDYRELSTNFPEQAAIPEMAALESAAEHRDISRMEIDEEKGTVYLADPDMRLDVGAIAKGYATERIAEKLEAEGFECFALNAGGNVRVAGAKPDGSPWKVGVTDPTAPDGGYVGIVDAVNTSVVTSGSYQRFFTVDGIRYHHIIDGDTLYPENRYLSVTVVTEKSDLADALSTALFNMELAEGKTFVESLEGVEALWILPDESLAASSGFIMAD